MLSALETNASSPGNGFTIIDDNRCRALGLGKGFLSSIGLYCHWLLEFVFFHVKYLRRRICLLYAPRQRRGVNGRWCHFLGSCQASLDVRQLKVETMRVEAIVDGYGKVTVSMGKAQCMSVNFEW